MRSPHTTITEQQAPLSATGEKSVQQERPSTAKNKINKITHKKELSNDLNFSIAFVHNMEMELKSSNSNIN